MPNKPLGWLAELPKPIRACVGGASVIVALVILSLLLRSPEADRALELAASAADSTATPLDRRASPSSQAASRTPAPADARDETRALPTERSDDPRASADARELHDRFLREVQGRRLNDAVTTLDYLARADPKAADDREMRSAIVKLSQRVTQAQGRLPDVFFEILAQRMGTVGADILYEIITTKGESQAADRAAALLRDADVRDRGTPALQVAYELRVARSCAERVDLLDRVKAHGDRRTLLPLLDMSRRCGRDLDCCTRDDPRVKDAMDGLRARGIKWD
jgi:hypothetical protein